MLKKRCILFVMAVLAVCVALTGCTKEAAKEQKAPEVKATVLRISSVLPETHPTHKGMLYFAEKVKEKTKGSVEVKVFPSSQLGEQRDALEGLKIGTLEMALTSTGPLGQFVPALDVFNLPYIFRDVDHMHKALAGDPGKKMEEEILKAGFRPVFWCDSGTRNVILAKKAVRSPEDLNGQKVRVMPSNMMADTLNNMGAIATPMGQGEVYNALQSGVIDGWENSPITLYTLKLYEVSKQFSWTRHFITPDVILIGTKTYDKLTPEQQKAIVEAGKEAGVKQREYWAEAEKSAVEELKAKGVVFTDIPDISPFAKRVKPVWKVYTDKFGTTLVDEIQAIK